MRNRRAFLLTLTSGVVASALIVGTTFAEELLGVITKVTPDANKVTVVEKGSDKEIEIKVSDATEYVNAKGVAAPINLEKVEKNLAKAIEKGRKGINVTVTHDKGAASKIAVAAKKQ